MSKALELDTSQFEKQMNLLLKEHPRIIGKVVMQTAFQIVNNANTEPRKTPHLEGHLRADVNVKLIDSNIAQIHYQKDYAAKVHEWTDPEPKWSESDVGPKYLERQLMQGERYGRLMGEIHKEQVEGLS